MSGRFQNSTPPLIPQDGIFNSVFSSNFVSDSITTSGNITITGDITSSAGDALTISTGYSSSGTGLLLVQGGNDTSDTITGGNVEIRGGDGLTGGYAWLFGGDGSGGNGGSVSIRSGRGESSGGITLQSGTVDGATGSSGDISLLAWFGFNGGDINLISGLGIGGTSGDVNITASSGGNLIINVGGTTYAWPTSAPTNGQQLTATVPGATANVDLGWV